jgi:hypothetical protein
MKRVEGRGQRLGKGIPTLFSDAWLDLFALHFPAGTAGIL